jgi:phosphatidylglycerol---prolipoprotein diacylglyceryl transferase
VRHAFLFDLDPALAHLEIRYYGIIFAAALYLGYLLWRWQMLRGGHSQKLADRFVVWGVIAVVAGSRLGHCLFYEPERYLRDPLSILYVWQGGLSSHGAAIALAVALLAFARREGLSRLDVLDRFSMSAALGAAAVRLGNFLNSEIVGRPTTVPWAVVFKRVDRVTRHPSQLYELAIGLVVLFVLYMADRRAGRESRPAGLLAGLFLSLYFLARFFVEFVKEPQSGFEAGLPLTMGQILSIPGFLAGVLVLAFVYREDQKRKIAAS